MQAKKILVGIDHADNATSVMDFTLRFFNRENVLLVGIPLQSEVSQAPKKSPALDVFLGRAKASVTRFSVSCEATPQLQELHRETKFADLLVIPAETWLANQQRDSEHSIYNVLSTVCCPVIAVPADYTDVRNIILTYDGSLASFFAIKQFCYLFSDACSGAEVTLLTLLHEDNDFDLVPAEEKLLVAYLKQHCRNLGVYKVIGEPQEIIHKHVAYTPDSLLVMSGATGNELSGLFRHTGLPGDARPKSAPAFIA